MLSFGSKHILILLSFSPQLCNRIHGYAQRHMIPHLFFKRASRLRGEQAAKQFTASLMCAAWRLDGKSDRATNKKEGMGTFWKSFGLGTGPFRFSSFSSCCVFGGEPWFVLPLSSSRSLASAHLRPWALLDLNRASALLLFSGLLCSVCCCCYWISLCDIFHFLDASSFSLILRTTPLSVFGVLQVFVLVLVFRFWFLGFVRLGI